MGKSFDEAAVTEPKLAGILLKEPYLEYIATIGVSKIGPHRGNTALKSDESLSDWCICVGLNQQPPKELKLIHEYEGVRVFYKVIGF